MNAEGVELPAAPKSAGVFKVESATVGEDNSVTVTLEGGGTVTIPAGSRILCNGVGNMAANVPAWLAYHAAEKKRVEEENRKLFSEGKKLLDPVTPVRLVIADTDDGPLARFDQ